MPRDPRVDAYIESRAEFARPILLHIRALMHGVSTDIGEAMKWGMPFFTYRGQNLANMAAFKGHAAFGFWHDKVARDEAADEKATGESAMGQFGRLTALADLPPDDRIAALVRQAMALIDAGDKPRAGPKQPRAPLPVHPAFQAALDSHAAALTVWTAFPPGKVRDYCEWINDAKTDTTRDKRIAQALEWIADGKGRNWKYEKR